MAEYCFYDLLSNSEDIAWIKKTYQLSLHYLYSLSHHRSHYLGSCQYLPSSSSTDSLLHITTSPSSYLKYYKEKQDLSPILEIFIDILLSHCLNCTYKYGWLSIHIATNLVLRIRNEDKNQTRILQGYQYAYEIIMNEMKNDQNSIIKYRFHWSNHQIVLSLIKNLLDNGMVSCALNRQEIHHIASCLLEAFISSLFENNEQKYAPNVVFYQIPSVSPSNMLHYPGTVILNIPIPPMFPTVPIKNVFVAVFEQSIELIPNGDLKIEIQRTLNQSSDCTELISAKQAEYQILRTMCDIIINSNVQLLCCQKRIHPYLQQLLRKKGVICLPRLSIFHINKILAISGAQQLGAFSTSIERSQFNKELLHLPSLGYIDMLSLDVIAGKEVLIVQASAVDDLQDDSPLKHFPHVDLISSRRSFISSITICGWHQNQLSEIQQLSENVIRTLTLLIQSDNSTVLPGSGCWLRYLVNHLNSQLELKRSYESDFLLYTGAKLFCDVLEGAACALAASIQDIDTEIDQYILPRSSSKGIVTFQSPTGKKTIAYYHPGQSLIDNSGEEIESGYVISSDALDPYRYCYHALHISLEAASCILDIDGILIQSDGNDIR